MPDLADVARRLLTLEVDTIVSDGIVADRMPSDGQALIRIAQLYKDFLARVVDEVEANGGAVEGLPAFVGEDGRARAFMAWDVRTGGIRTFDALRAAARACQAARAAVPRPHAMRAEHDPILARVAGGCGDVRDILRRMGLDEATVDGARVAWAEEAGTDWPRFDGDALLTLRRLWETGVDVVVMQSIVRLDGSVVTRVLDGWDRPEAATLHGLHYCAVDIALARWGVLVGTARDLAAFFFGGGAAGRGPPEPGAPGGHDAGARGAAASPARAVAGPAG